MRVAKAINQSIVKFREKQHGVISPRRGRRCDRTRKMGKMPFENEMEGKLEI
jgi:hypothetical protein